MRVEESNRVPAFGLPDRSLSAYLAIAPAAVGVVLVGFAEGLGAAKTYASKNHYEIDANRELLGLGAANLGAGLSAGMVVNGSLSKTAVNGSSGAKSQVSGLIVAALSVLTLLFLTGLFSDLPDATLAAVVIAAIVELVDVDSLRELYRNYTRRLGRIYGVAARPDFIAALAALLGVLIFDTLPGLFIGIAVSVLLMVYRASRPNVPLLGAIGPSGVYVDIDRHPEAVAPHGVEVVRIESALFFANAEFVRARVSDRARVPGTQAVVIDAETIPAVDVTAVRMLTELSERLSEEGVVLALARNIGQVRDLMPAEGDNIRFFDSVEDAVSELAGSGDSG